MQPDHAPIPRHELLNEQRHEHPDVQPNVLLTLALPQALEEDVLDVLAAHASQAPGFTVLAAQGMGRHEHLGSAMEQILGRSQRRMVQVAMAQGHVAPLLDALHQALPNPAISYWVSPLLAFGHLGAVPAALTDSTSGAAP